MMAIMMAAITSYAASELGGLEEALRNRQFYIESKQARIDSIKQRLNAHMSPMEKLECYDELYEQYLTFRFDSAMAYLDCSEQLLDEDADYELRSRIQIHRALSLATSGHFSQAADLLESINPAKLSVSLRRELYNALQWTYGVWAEYSGRTAYAKQYNGLSVAYLDSLIAYTDRNTTEYHYHFADYSLRQKEYEAARDNYLKALANTPRNTRLYAQAAYGLAAAYKALGDAGKYREWLRSHLRPGHTFEGKPRATGTGS